MLFLRFLFLLLAIAGPCGEAFSDDSALARLKADLLANPSATQVLTKWCGDLHLATPAVIRAERDLQRAVNELKRSMNDPRLPVGGAETIVTPKSPRRSTGPVTVKDCTGTFCTLMSVVESLGVNDGHAVA